MKFCNCRRILNIYSQGLLRVMQQLAGVHQLFSAANQYVFNHNTVIYVMKYDLLSHPCQSV